MKRHLRRFWRWFTLADLGQVQIGGNGSTMIQAGRSYEVDAAGRRIRDGRRTNRALMEIDGDGMKVTIEGDREYVIRMMELSLGSLKRNLRAKRDA